MIPQGHFAATYRGDDIRTPPPIEFFFFFFHPAADARTGFFVSSKKKLYTIVQGNISLEGMIREVVLFLYFKMNGLHTLSDLMKGAFAMSRSFLLHGRPLRTVACKAIRRR